MNFKHKNPKLILKSSYYDEYKREIELIWHEIVDLNTIQFIATKIVPFKFNIIYPQKPLFWQITTKNLFESSIMIISKLTLDNNDNSLTIGSLSDKIKTNFIDRNYMVEFEGQFQIQLL